MARLTVTDQLYHQAGGKPDSHGSAFSRDLRDNEQLWKRRATATENWEPLDLGWIAEPSLVVVEHVGGGGKDAPPVLVGVEHGDQVVPVTRVTVGCSVRIEPVGRLYVRCDALRRINVVAVPA